LAASGFGSRCDTASTQTVSRFPSFEFGLRLQARRPPNLIPTRAAILCVESLVLPFLVEGDELAVFSKVPLPFFDVLPCSFPVQVVLGYRVRVSAGVVHDQQF
jgi:hypothetical protein